MIKEFQASEMARDIRVAIGINNRTRTPSAEELRELKKTRREQEDARLRRAQKAKRQGKSYI
jgi:hypothetical protein